MRLFDADALRAVLIPLEQKYAGAYADLGAVVGCIVQQIDGFPAVDAVIVTRCKDCKYGDYDSKPGGAMVCLRTNDGFWRKETDFCSYGEYQTNSGGNEHE